MFNKINVCCFCFIVFSVNALANSLIDPDHYRGLSSDKRAYRLGDPIVVRVIESTTAESSAGTDSRKGLKLGGQIKYGDSSQDATLGLTGQSEGAGQTSRRGRAFTQISTRIVETFPGQLYRIEGKQQLIINGENQQIQISGLIRGEDIEKDNTLQSTRISEAKIEIQGEGVVDTAQRQSIIYRIMTWLGLL